MPGAAPAWIKKPENDPLRGRREMTVINYICIIQVYTCKGRSGYF
jgi:hypothetical protein